GCDPTGCGGGTAQPSPEQGSLGGAEAVGHRRQLRKGNFQPKQHLEHLVEKLKLLGLEGGGEEKERLCSWRKRTFASRGDVKASRSNHEGPRACGAPAAAQEEELAQEDKERIRRDLEKLKKEREAILESKRSGERRCQDYLVQTEVQRRKIVSEFRQLRRFLKDQELILLVRLGELDREMMGRQEEEDTRVSGQVSLLDVLICEVEKMLEQPASRFLQVGGKVFASRWETNSAREMTETFSELERRLSTISRQTNALGEALRRFRAFVTLDPDTANARLLLSQDRRGVRWGDVVGQEVPPTPQRFDVSCCVLARRGFAGGTHSWAVEVAAGTTWALGVARGSVPRKGWLEFGPEKGIWALGRRGNRYRAFASPVTTFPASGSTGRVRVALDYGAGQVAFYLAGRDLPVFVFQRASFGGEDIFPFFWV
ncbi:TRIM7 ligase, partial [Crotophaga sulcirostris]|nr:TRIM7 ligase [Crotophaga sulcirostris]